MTSFQNPVSFQHQAPAHIIQSDAEALEIAQNLAAQFKAGAVQRDAQRLLPFQEIEAYSQSGLWAITVPKAYGGAEVSSYTVAQVIALMSGADGSIGQIPQNHFYALEVLRNTGTEQQKRKLYAEVLNGARFGNALAEFKTKTASQKQTSILKKDAGLEVNGEKFYCTGSLFAHRIPTLVKDADGREFLAFIPRESQGLELIDDWSGFGQRSTASGTVILDNIQVDAEYVIQTGAGGESINLVGTISQLIHSSIDVGIAHAAIEDAIEFVQNYTRPWIDADQEYAVDDQFTQAAVADLKIKLHAAEALLDRAGDYVDAALENLNEDNANAATLAVAEAKVLSAEIAILASNKLFELAGTRAALSELNLDRHWRNARIHTLHDPVRWKYKLIGEYYLKGKYLPRHPWS